MNNRISLLLIATVFSFSACVAQEGQSDVQQNDVASIEASNNLQENAVAEELEALQAPQIDLAELFSKMQQAQPQTKDDNQFHLSPEDLKIFMLGFVVDLLPSAWKFLKSYNNETLSNDYLGLIGKFFKQGSLNGASLYVASRLGSFAPKLSSSELYDAKEMVRIVFFYGVLKLFSEILQDSTHKYKLRKIADEKIDQAGIKLFNESKDNAKKLDFWKELAEGQFKFTQSNSFKDIVLEYGTCQIPLLLLPFFLRSIKKETKTQVSVKN